MELQLNCPCTLPPAAPLCPYLITDRMYVCVCACAPPPWSSDYCSTLKITDQSNQIVWCTIFSKNLVDHPTVEVGDVIRLHRVKVRHITPLFQSLYLTGWSPP